MHTLHYAKSNTKVKMNVENLKKLPNNNYFLLFIVFTETFHYLFKNVPRRKTKQRVGPFA